MRREWILGALIVLAGCASKGPPAAASTATREQPRSVVERAIPRGVTDRAGWGEDIYNGLKVQGLEPSRQNVCAVVAVIEQESNFQVNTVVPGLGEIARKEIDARAEHAGLPLMIVHTALDLKSSTGRTYGERIATARTEKDLSDVYEDFIGSVPLGRKLFADWNPIRTRGPMQVNVTFAEQYAQVRPYPYPVKDSIGDELFTRRGSVYFGIAHLLAYKPPYNDYLYRFADYNAGQYASRNAAFQNAVGAISGRALVTDGALVSHENGASLSDTELALRSIAARLNASDDDIHSALEQGKTKDFEHTAVYERVFALAERLGRRPWPRAIVPSIKLHGPKISRSLTTSWYAHRVDGRYERCLAQ